MSVVLCRGLPLQITPGTPRLDAIRLKRERQHRSVMSEEEEEDEDEEEEGIHYVEKTLFYWFSVREMANVLWDNLASIKTPSSPQRCEESRWYFHDYVPHSYCVLQTHISHVYNVQS